MVEEEVTEGYGVVEWVVLFEVVECGGTEVVLEVEVMSGVVLLVVSVVLALAGARDSHRYDSDTL